MTAFNKAWIFLKEGEEESYPGENEFLAQRRAGQEAEERVMRLNDEALRTEYHSVPCPRCGATEEQPCVGPPYTDRRAQHNVHKERELAVGRVRMGE